MRPVSAANLFGVARVRVHLADGFGNEKEGNATGFWLETPEERKLIFVTNKHVVDPRLAKPGTSFLLDRLSIALRKVDHLDGGGQVFGRETEYFGVTNLVECLFANEARGAPDCAIICDPQWERDPGLFEAIPFGFQHFLVDDDGFQRGDIELCDRVSFIGFPATAGGPWWDEAAGLPIVREGTIASLPRLSFTNRQVTTSETMLVSGLSFAGSSGSPVIAHGRPHNVPTRQGHIMGETPSLLIGIMSGHFHDAQPDTVPEMFRHSGLSYLTRSGAIIQLVNEARDAGFRNPAPFGGLHSVRTARFASPSE